jgi:hypothetical protein
MFTRIRRIYQAWKLVNELKDWIAKHPKVGYGWLVLTCENYYLLLLVQIAEEYDEELQDIISDLDWELAQKYPLLNVDTWCVPESCRGMIDTYTEFKKVNLCT